MKSMHCTFMCNPLFSLHEQILSEVKESQLVTLSSPFFNLFCVVGVKLQQCSSAQNVLNFFSFFGCLFQFFFFFGTLFIGDDMLGFFLCLFCVCVCELLNVCGLFL